MFRSCESETRRLQPLGRKNSLVCSAAFCATVVTRCFRLPAYMVKIRTRTSCECIRGAGLTRHANVQGLSKPAVWQENQRIQGPRRIISLFARAFASPSATRRPHAIRVYSTVTALATTAMANNSTARRGPSASHCS